MWSDTFSGGITLYLLYKASPSVNIRLWNKQILTFQVILNPNIQILGRCCLCTLFGPLLQFICQSRVGLDWNGLSAWYFFLYFHFHRWLGNCFEEGDTAAWRWKLKRCLPWNASDILASTKFDFWADKSRFLSNKSWRLREKSGLMLMQGAAS